MIYDKIENIGRYRGMSERLDKAIDFLRSTNLEALPLGRTEIDGSHVFANVMEAAAGDEETNKFEIHRRYMDIQIDLEGTEIIQVGLDPARVLDAYQEETDFGTVVCEKDTSCVMGPGRFIICMAREPHKPGIAAGPDRRLKKCVIKVETEKGEEGNDV